LCVEAGGQYFRVARISETAKRVEVWTQQYMQTYLRVTLEICSNLCELEALLTRYNNKNKMTSIIRG